MTGAPELHQLTHERSKLHKRLEEIEEEIRQLGGEQLDLQAPARAAPHNEKSLTQTIEAILLQANQPMRVYEIATKVQEAGV